MKQIEFQIPEGYIIDKELSTDTKLVYKLVDKKLTYEDVAKGLFKNKKSWFFSTEIDGIECNENGFNDGDLEDCENSPTKEQLESILALNKLCNVAKYLNGDWLPSKGHYKGFLYLMGANSTIEVSSNGNNTYSYVYFKSAALARQAIEILGEDEIRKALILNH